MKLHLCFSALLAPFVSLHAATWTVDNNTAHPADFRTIQSAIDAAAVGDTILVAASQIGYEGFTSTKRLNIKGDAPSQSGLRARITGGLVTLTEIYDDVSPDHLRNAGGSFFEGLAFSVSVTVLGPCSGVTFKRCQSSSQQSITLRGCSGALIVNCHLRTMAIHNGSLNGTNYTGSGNSVVGTWADQFYPTSPANTLAENCVFGYYSGGSGQSDPLRTGVIVDPPFTVRNSIIISKSSMDTHIAKGVFDHCLSIGASTLPAGSGNINLPYTEFGNVFVDATPYTSTNNPPAEVFILKTGSPAIGAGLNAVDMGMYGGVSPFVPGQVPALPRILYFQVPPVVPDSTGLTFEVQAEARD